jgi:hypothetical protein
MTWGPSGAFVKSCIHTSVAGPVVSARRWSEIARICAIGAYVRPAVPSAENSRGGGAAPAVLLPPWRRGGWRRSAMGRSPSPSRC